MAVFFTYLFNVFAIALPGMDFAPFKKPRAEVWGFSRIAALFLAFPVKSCFATFHGAPQGTLCPDLRVFFLACTPDENRPFLRVPRLGVCYRGASICVATFHGSLSGGFLFCCYFSLGIFPCTSPFGSASSVAWMLGFGLQGFSG